MHSGALLSIVKACQVCINRVVTAHCSTVSTAEGLAPFACMYILLALAHVSRGVFTVLSPFQHHHKTSVCTKYKKGWRNKEIINVQQNVLWGGYALKTKPSLSPFFLAVSLFFSLSLSLSFSLSLSLTFLSLSISQEQYSLWKNHRSLWLKTIEKTSRFVLAFSILFLFCNITMSRKVMLKSIDNCHRVSYKHYKCL